MNDTQFAFECQFAAITSLPWCSMRSSFSASRASSRTSPIPSNLRKKPRPPASNHRRCDNPTMYDIPQCGIMGARAGTLIVAFQESDLDARHEIGMTLLHQTDIARFEERRDTWLQAGGRRGNNHRQRRAVICA